MDLGAIADNWRTIAALAAAAECAAVVKANAYGLGIDRVAPVLWRAGARHFFAAPFKEGGAPRAVGASRKRPPRQGRRFRPPTAPPH